MSSIKPVRLAFKITEPPVRKNEKDIIVIHGISDCKEVFDDIVKDLACQTGRRLYSVDLRNHGDSDHSEDFNVDATTIDILNFMDEHSIKSAVIFGHSLGGRLAMNIALVHPKRTECIIVEDMTPKAVPNDILNSYAKLMKLMHESIDLVPLDVNGATATEIIFENILKKKPSNILLNMKIMDEKEYPLPLKQNDRKHIWKTNFPIIKNVQNLKFDEDMQGLYEYPALFVCGAHSEFNVSSDRDFILNMFPKAQFHQLPASHNVHYELSDEFVSIVAKFLD